MYNQYITYISVKCNLFVVKNKNKCSTKDYKYKDSQYKYKRFK